MRWPAAASTIFSALSFSASSSPSSALSDLASCIASLQACARRSDLSRGRELHSWMLSNGLLASPLSVTSLINMYSKCSQMPDALSVFRAHHRSSNLYAWNALIAGYVANGLAAEGFRCYGQMRHAGVAPDKFTFPCAIRASCDAFGVRKIHGELFKCGLEFDPFVGSALASSYLKFGWLCDAHHVFDEMPMRDGVLYNALINGYAQIGESGLALEVFRRMSEEGFVPSKFTVTGVLSVLAVMEDMKNGCAMHGFVIKKRYDLGVAVSNALIDMYGKCKCIEDAVEIFDTMVGKDIYSWNSIISVHEQSGDHDRTIRLFDQMLGAAMQPDLVTVTAVLPACAHLAALGHGREIHGFMIVTGMGKDFDDRVINDIFVNNAIMDMYAKCGSMRDARLIFSQMIRKDVASWNIMIMGYGMHGHGHLALDMFSKMCGENLKPDEVTFVGVLSACNHAGFVNQGHGFLKEMKLKYGVVPTIEHYTCVIDMLGRAGKLDKAYQLLSTMPVESNAVVWRAFLGACRIHKNVDLAEVAARKVFELDPDHCGNYVLMSNVYGLFGRFGEVQEIRHAMKQQNVRKTPGCSWLELGSGVNVFVTADATHPQSTSIYTCLTLLTACLRDNGYAPSI